VTLSSEGGVSSSGVKALGGAALGGSAGSDLSTSMGDCSSFFFAFAAALDFFLRLAISDS
jgi:hypothetical protein